MYLASNQTPYKNQFFYGLGKAHERLFSDLYYDVCHVHDLCTFEEEGRCEIHKDCQNCKQKGREIHIKDILTLAVWDDKLREEFKKLKGNDCTEDMYLEAGNTWDLENATKEAYKQKQTLTKKAFMQ